MTSMNLINTGYLDRVLGIVCSVFDAYSAVLFLPDKSRSDYRLAAMFSLGDKVNPDIVVKPGKGIVGWIIRNNKPLLINNFEKKRSRLNYYDQGEEAKIKAFMGCPLNQRLGALCLDSKRTYSFSEKDQKILHLFANLIEDAQTKYLRAEENLLESSYYSCLQLLLNLKNRTKRWPEFLGQYLKLLSETAGFDYCFLAARDETDNTYFLEHSNPVFLTGNDDGKKFSLNSGLIGWVFKNGTGVYSGEKEGAALSPLFGKEARTPDFRSVICLPLGVNRQTRGVMCLAHEQALDISEQLKNFTRNSADYLALFLENLYLKSRLKELAAISNQTTD